MDERELREMVREAVARHLGRDAAGPPPPPRFAAHASHLRLALASGGDGEGACLIEPAVRCNHCGFCQSLGH